MNRKFLSGKNLVRIAVGASLVAGTAALAAAPLKITLAGGSVGGAWSAMGAAIGETIRLASPGSSFTYEPGRDAANVQLVSTGKVQLGITHAQMALRGARGEAPFKQKATNIKALALLDPAATVQIIVRKDSPFTGLDQIAKEKKPIRIALNQRGTMMSVVGEEVFKNAGISMKDITDWGGRVEYVAFNGGLEMLKNNQVDLVLNMLAFPSAQLVGLARDVPVKLLPIPVETVKKMTDEVGTKPVEIPANAYAFETKSIPTVNGSVALIASDQMSEDEAATIVAGMIQHFDYLSKAYPSFARMGKKALPDVKPLTLHPGAVRAYKAAGLL